MAKGERDKLEKKLARAQLKLREADEGVAATRIEGEQAVQRARLKAEKELAKARRELARRVEKVTRLEREVREESAGGSRETVTTPDQAADEIERIEVEHETDEQILVFPE